MNSKCIVNSSLSDVLEAYNNIDWCKKCPHQKAQYPSDEYEDYCLNCNQSTARKKYNNWEAIDEQV